MTKKAVTLAITTVVDFGTRRESVKNISQAKDAVVTSISMKSKLAVNTFKKLIEIQIQKRRFLFIY